MKKRVALSVIAVCVSVLAGVSVFQRLNDFPVYHLAANSLLAGRTDLYSTTFAGGAVMDYRYPPLFLVLFLPLFALPFAVSSFIWYGFSVAQMFLCFDVVRRVVDAAKTASFNSLAAWTVMLFVTGQYFAKNLKAGNAHLLITALTFVALWLMVRRKHEVAGALCLALAITIKLTPVFFLPYLLIKKRWRMLIATGVLLIGLNLLPAVYFGWNENLKLLDAWARHVTIDNAEFHELQGPINQSLKGQLRRVLTEVDYTQRLSDKNYQQINITALDTRFVNRLAFCLSLALYGLSLGLIWLNERRVLKPETSVRHEALEIGLVFCAMLLCAPSTAKIYFIALLWTVASLACFAWRNVSRTARIVRIILYFAALINFTLPLVPGSDAARLFLVLGTDFYVTLLLMAACAYAVWNGEVKE